MSACKVHKPYSGWLLEFAGCFLIFLAKKNETLPVFGRGNGYALQVHRRTRISIPSKLIKRLKPAGPGWPKP